MRAGSAEKKTHHLSLLLSPEENQQVFSLLDKKCLVSRREPHEPVKATIPITVSELWSLSPSCYYVTANQTVLVNVVLSYENYRNYRGAGRATRAT